MILVDSSVWIEHFKHADARLSNLLETRQLFVHPFVIAEVLLGHVRNRKVIADMMAEMPRPVIPGHGEVLDLILAGGLIGAGIGLVDAHLLASVRLTPAARLWTRDKRLRRVAEDFGISADGG